MYVNIQIQIIQWSQTIFQVNIKLKEWAMLVHTKDLNARARRETIDHDRVNALCQF